MATVKALIRRSKQNSKGMCVVYVRYGHKQKTFDVSTGIKVSVSNWNETKAKVNSVSSIKKNKANEELIKNLSRTDEVSNKEIETIISKLEKISSDLKVLKRVDPEVGVVKSEFLKGTSDQNQEDLSIKYINDLYADFISQINRSAATKEKHRNAQYHINEYEKHINKKLTVSDINLKFYDGLVNFLFTHFKKPDESIGLADNTVGTTIKNLKVLFKHLIKRGYPIKVDLDDFKRPKSNTPVYFLTEEEIDQLRNFEFKENRLVRVRDVFVFNCYCGLRISDLKRLAKHHIVNGSIKMRSTKKQQKDINVPLSPIPKSILEKYDYELPLISEQKYNEYIKEACKKAKIDSNVDVFRFVSGNKQIESIPKHEVMSSHIAVKTFISLCGKKGVRIKDVSMMLGKSVAVINKYYDGTDEDNIIDSMKSAFG